VQNQRPGGNGILARDLIFPVSFLFLGSSFRVVPGLLKKYIYFALNLPQLSLINKFSKKNIIYEAHI
jgi:hypothetical protein